MFRVLDPPPPATIGVAGSTSIVSAGKLKADISPMEQNPITRNGAISTVRNWCQNNSYRVLPKIGALRSKQVSIAQIVVGNYGRATTEPENNNDAKRKQRAQVG
jgi:hypothetical protein